MSDSTHLSSESHNPKPVVTSAEDTSKHRDHPIPPASHPRQYRAIGLVRGIYSPDEEEQLGKGNIATEDGQIEAVLLGRVISLVKNHIDLEQEHLWVVYPRTRQEDNHLHLQILGIWEPENLDQQVDESDEEATPVPSDQVDDGYFSIRGQIIFYDQDSQKVIVKIRQSPKKTGEKPKFFKLQLSGILPERPINHFYDLHVKLQDKILTITASEDMGYISNRRKPGGNKYGGKRGVRYSKDKPQPKFSKTVTKSAAARERPIPKPKPKTLDS